MMVASMPVSGCETLTWGEDSRDTDQTSRNNNKHSHRHAEHICESVQPEVAGQPTAAGSSWQLVPLTNRVRLTGRNTRPYNKLPSQSVRARNACCTICRIHYTKGLLQVTLVGHSVGPSNCEVQRLVYK